MGLVYVLGQKKQIIKKGICNKNTCREMGWGCYFYPETGEGWLYSMEGDENVGRFSFLSRIEIQQLICVASPCCSLCLYSQFWYCMKSVKFSIFPPKATYLSALLLKDDETRIWFRKELASHLSYIVQHN